MGDSPPPLGPHRTTECASCGATICCELEWCWPCYYQTEDASGSITPEEAQYPYACSEKDCKYDPRHAPGKVKLCTTCLNGAAGPACKHHTYKEVLDVRRP